MKIKVVNMIPQSLSGETNQDSEPNIAVNPANPSQIAASAFTPDPMGGANAPIYVSTNGGDAWSLNNIVPSTGSLGTGDITLRFAGTSSRMFASILDGSTGAFEVHRTTNFTSPAAMTQTMNFVERLFGISPDGGNGTFEFLLFFISVLLLLLVSLWRRVKWP
jgi:hypothetical protein